jgi:hypothetical protein
MFEEPDLLLLMHVFGFGIKLYSNQTLSMAERQKAGTGDFPAFQ